MGKMHAAPPPPPVPNPRAPRERPPSGVHQTALAAANETRTARRRPPLSDADALIAGRHAKSWDSHDLLIAYLWFNVLTQGIDGPATDVSGAPHADQSLTPPVSDQWGGGSPDSSPNSSPDVQSISSDSSPSSSSSSSSYDSGSISSDSGSSSSSSSGGDL